VTFEKKEKNKKRIDCSKQRNGVSFHNEKVDLLANH